MSELAENNFLFSLKFSKNIIYIQPLKEKFLCSHLRNTYTTSAIKILHYKKKIQT